MYIYINVTYQLTDQWNGFFSRPDVRHRINSLKKGIITGSKKAIHKQDNLVKVMKAIGGLECYK